MDIAPHVIVRDCPQVTVHPLRHVGVGQGLGALVDQDIVVECHVVHLVVGGEGKSLRADLHANGFALGLRVHIALVIEDPIKILVSVEGHNIFSATVFAIDFLKKIVPRVISLLRRVVPIPVVILEGREVIVLVQIGTAVGGVVLEIRRHRIAVWEVLVHCPRRKGFKILAMTLGVRPCGHEEFVVFVASVGIDLCRAIVGERTWPKIIAIRAVADRSKFQLLVRADAANPQGTTENCGNLVLLWDDVSPTVRCPIVPKSSAILHKDPDVVPLQIAKGCGRRASRCSGSRLHQAHRKAFDFEDFQGLARLRGLGPSARRGRDEQSNGQDCHQARGAERRKNTK